MCFIVALGAAAPHAKIVSPVSTIVIVSEGIEVLRCGFPIVYIAGAK